MKYVLKQVYVKHQLTQNNSLKKKKHKLVGMKINQNKGSQLGGPTNFVGIRQYFQGMRQKCDKVYILLKLLPRIKLLTNAYK